MILPRCARRNAGDRWCGRDSARLDARRCGRDPPRRRGPHRVRARQIGHVRRLPRAPRDARRRGNRAVRRAPAIAKRCELRNRAARPLAVDRSAERPGAPLRAADPWVANDRPAAAGRAHFGPRAGDRARHPLAGHPSAGARRNPRVCRPAAAVAFSSGCDCRACARAEDSCAHCSRDDSLTANRVPAQRAVEGSTHARDAQSADFRRS